MSIRAVFFDFGGVILRTEYQAPRQKLAERFNMDYDDIDQAVFASESSKRASLGEISEEAHWLEVLKKLKQPASELQAFQDAFFGGDVIDRKLILFIRELREKNIHTGLISNAWSGLREYMTKEKVIDAFDSLAISSEIGAVKPQTKIYKHALQQANVNAEESVFVDDFAVNIEACEKLGMKGVLFKDPQKGMRDLKRFLKD
ncbi:MAG: HAD family phosphatase [Anaerolineales bacterium]|nr:HAD family phosphatase [Anaerolineales bacterium]